MAASLNHECTIRSSLPLQMCIYFNIYLFVAWIVFQLAQRYFFDYQTSEQNKEVYTFLWRASFLLLCLVELGRLYIGYLGNQLEKIQHLLAFVFLSTCFQLPNYIVRLTLIQCWNWHSFYQIITNLIIFILLLLEIVFSCWHLRKIFCRIYQIKSPDEDHWRS